MRMKKDKRLDKKNSDEITQFQVDLQCLCFCSSGGIMTVGEKGGGRRFFIFEQIIGFAAGWNGGLGIYMLWKEVQRGFG